MSDHSINTTEGGVPEHLDLRDWFAGQALVGLTMHAGGGLPYLIAEEAYKLADEMLKERGEAAT